MSKYATEELLPVTLDGLVMVGEETARVRREKQVENANKLYSTTIAALPGRMAIVMRLVEFGIIAPSEWSQRTNASLRDWYVLMCDEQYGYTLVTTDQLPALFSVFGKCRETDQYYPCSDDDLTHIQIVLDVGDGHNWANYFRIVRELPPNAKCKIVQETYTQTSTSVVCQNPNSVE